MLYVSLPMWIFLATWVVQPLGGLAAALHAALLWRAWAREPRQPGSGERHAWHTVVPLMGLAAIWSAFGGAGHLFHANAFDWIPRFGLARDLTVSAWPLGWRDDDATWLLRAPLGYYLAPTLLAKVTASPLAWLDPLLLAWTAAGAGLTLVLAFGHGRRPLWAGIAFTLCSGFDLLGHLMRHGNLPAAGEHIEWWARTVQYSSNSTLLFWVPNHTLAAWVVAALVVHRADDPRFVWRQWPLLMAPLALWSPLSALGFLPLALGAAWALWRQGGVPVRDFGLHALAAVLTGLPVLLYLAQAAGSVPTPGTGTALLSPSRLLKILRFILVEVGPWILLWRCRPMPAWAQAAVLTLCLLPFMRFGVSNDLVMRASIPALALMWIVLIQRHVQTPTAARQDRSPSPDDRTAGRTRPAWTTGQAFLLCLMLGMPTAAHEILRAAVEPSWRPDLQATLPQSFMATSQGQERTPPHYMVSGGWSAAFDRLAASPVHWIDLPGLRAGRLRPACPGAYDRDCPHTALDAGPERR